MRVPEHSCPEPQLGDWKQMVDALKNPTSEVTIALVGKIYPAS